MNADMKAVARKLVAWFTSGNSVPVDVRHAVKVNGDRIKADADRLNRSIHEDDSSTGGVDWILEYFNLYLHQRNGMNEMKTVSRYEIREFIGNEYSKPVFRQIVERSRASKIVKRLKKGGRQVFMAKMQVNA